MNLLSCDGCNATEQVRIGEFQGKEIKRIPVSILWAQTDADTNSFDLCGSCRDRLKANADPRTWPREQRAQAA